MTDLSVSRIQSEIDAASLGWQAAENPVSRLPQNERSRRLGLLVPPDERARIARAMADAAPLREVMVHTAERDWRDMGGHNFVSPIRDQQNCGSCVSFATVATIESQARIEYKAPAWAVDLSEADLFFCGGAKCAEGWWPAEALAYAADKGIADEACMPYSDHDQACTVSGDKADRMLKVGQWQEIAGVEQRKGWLDTSGPMIACLAVYEDFFSYSSGIYRHATGELAGYHAVSCVGFNDTEGYWLCKNSWGESWGDQGFFKIAYGQAEIDTSFAMYGVAGVNGTLKPLDDGDEGKGIAKYVVLQSDASTDMLYTYVNGKWRHLPLTGGRLAEIGATAFASHHVDVTFKGEKVIALSSWKKIGGGES